jgi:hypothetical protein
VKIEKVDLSLQQKAYQSIYSDFFERIEIPERDIIFYGELFDRSDDKSTDALVKTYELLGELPDFIGLQFASKSLKDGKFYIFGLTETTSQNPPTTTTFGSGSTFTQLPEKVISIRQVEIVHDKKLKFENLFHQVFFDYILPLLKEPIQIKKFDARTKMMAANKIFEKSEFTSGNREVIFSHKGKEGHLVLSAATIEFGQPIFFSPWNIQKDGLICGVSISDNFDSRSDFYVTEADYSGEVKTDKF